MDVSIATEIIFLFFAKVTKETKNVIKDGWCTKWEK